MLNFPGYKVFRKIYESDRSLVYRGVRSADGQPAIFKLLKQDYPTTAAVARHKQEYDIIRSLNLAGVVKAYSLEQYDRTLAIVLEDFGGESLKKLMKERPFTLSESLRLGIQIADTLGCIHSANIIHKDINPGNIVLNRSTNQLKIIDFGIASVVGSEKLTAQPALKNSHVLEGTLAYISPEQTGRMNRTVDYRTDYYSLGATLYEMLTRQLPFETARALELVHCHIAKQPKPAAEVDRAIPAAVSHIIAKLLAKNAEDRYQSAWGIKADLEECLHQLNTRGQISEISLASQDICDRFQISQKLYGRETQTKTLLAAVERVTDKRPRSTGQKRVEIMLVAGDSGTGKSSLVQEIYKPIIEKHGYFITGKFERSQQNVPYSAALEAGQELLQQILTESEEKFQYWRRQLLTALAPNAQLIIDVIPDLELIVGKQPAVQELEKNEIQNRFHLVFLQFWRVFCSPEHPLVIFLDDLQWADSASLKLIQQIAAGSVAIPASETLEGSELTTVSKLSLALPEYLLIVGAYRDKDVSAVHPLMLAAVELRKQGATVNQITLPPLEIADITNLIADTLHGDKKSAAPLAALVRRKTGGNPFFVSEFLKMLHAENLITFSFSCCPQLTLSAENGVECQPGWQWDIERIEEMEITNNVVDLMVGKLQKLPDATQQVLRLAACAGTDFDLHLLSAICQKFPQLVFADLKPALESGLILPVSEVNGELLIVNFKFLHDRLQQAAYALIDEPDKKLLHWQIGCWLWKNTEDSRLADEIFKIVDHLNIRIKNALNLTEIFTQEERDKIANLNLMAGKKAKAVAAYAAAVMYLTVSRRLLADSSWQNQYGLTLNIYVESVEAAYLSGEFELMEQLAGTVLLQGKTVLDNIKVYEVKIQAYIVQRRQLEAIALAREVLAQFGISFAQNPSDLSIQRELEQTKAKLAGRNIEDLISLPLMTSPEQLAAMRIAASIVPAAFHCAPQLLTPLVLSQINLCIQYGNSPTAAFFYAAWGVVVNCESQDIESANKLGELALNLVAMLNAKSLRGKILYVVAACIAHSKYHVRETLPMFRESYQSALQNGDFEFVAYCAKQISQYSYFLGRELTGLKREIAESSNLLERLKQSINLQCNQIFHQAVMNLLNEADNPCNLSGTACQEEHLLPLLAQANDRTGIHYFYLHKLILCYLFGDLLQARENAAKFRKNLTEGTGFLTVPVFHFYDSLIALAAYPEAEVWEREILLEQVAENQIKMQTWAAHAPMNHLHKFHLVEAEKYRVLGDNFQAMEEYDRAIGLAKQNEYMNEEALAHELAAKFYLGWGKEKIARVYLADAHYCYTHWGAKAKVENLEKNYPKILIRIPTATSMTSDCTTITNISNSGDSRQTFDLAAVMKASGAIASEIVLDKLLAKLMRIMLQNAGAEKGFLILENKGKLLVEASGKVDGDRVDVLQSIPAEKCLPSSIVNYVARTKQSVVENHASKKGNFTRDLYIKKNSSKSILCAPLLNQGNLIGIIYLENNLTTRAFTDDRVEVLQLLSTQAAVSIANAKLYAEVRESQSKLTQFLEALPVGITVHDRQGEVSYINQTGQRLLGQVFAPEATGVELVSASEIYISGSDSPCSDRQLPALRALEGESAIADNLEVRKNGKIVPLEMHSQPIFDNKNNIVYAITAFSDITARKQADKLIAEYSRTLEMQVADRTRELTEALQNLQATQRELIQSEKMAALGQLVAGVAHEINTPLGAIRSSVENLADFFNQNLAEIADFFHKMSPERYADLLLLLPKYQPQYLGFSNREKRQIKRAFVRQLSNSSVANPETVADTLVDIGIYDNIESILPVLQDPTSSDILQQAYQLSSLQRSTNTIITATDRAAKVVFALKRYSRSNCTGEKVIANITDGIETILTLYYNQLKQGVEVVRNYQDGLPELLCYPDELNQVWTNLIHNALQAMDNCGVLTLEVRAEDRSLLVGITDSGKGISPEILPRIFEPFFTTKPPGEGSGLGLDIVKKIVEKHSGKIEVVSAIGQTTFTVSMPIVV
ncbi:AAA family ATPase [Microcoleus sp. herbarium19]|uniref:trifunctional serine/threonine-protein kinase/ATP-binding protein/sensor histidine kinase n=1 Tax=unclassified Microcoleus TaxID=2642155 RepID=UPI002FD49B1B